MEGKRFCAAAEADKSSSMALRPEASHIKETRRRSVAMSLPAAREEAGKIKIY
jgi:hypothetical protein